MLAILLLALSADTGFVVSRPDKVGFVVTETKHPLDFKPVTVKVSPECGCGLTGPCKCVDCKCSDSLKHTGSGGATSSPSASNERRARRRVAAQRPGQNAWPPTYKPRAAQNCPNGDCNQMQRRGFFGRRQ